MCVCVCVYDLLNLKKELEYSAQVRCIAIVADLVMKGEVEVKHAGTTLGFLSEGSFFGESPVLADDQEPGSLIRSRTIVAVTDCDMCYLTRDSVQGLMLEYPELEKRIKSLAHFGRSNSQSKIWARVSALARMRLKLKKTAERARRNSINPSAANIAIKKIEKQIKEEDDQLQKMASGFREEDSRQQKVLVRHKFPPPPIDMIGHVQVIMFPHDHVPPIYRHHRP